MPKPHIIAIVTITVYRFSGILQFSVYKPLLIATIRPKSSNAISMNILIKLIYGLFKCLPLGAVRLLGRCLGWLLWRCNSNAAKVCRKNIQLCWPQLSTTQQQALVRAATIEMAITALELFKVWSSSIDWVQPRIVARTNETLYNRALAANKPVILAVPHLGNWEVVGLYAATRKPMTSMYAPIKYPAIDHIVKRSREASGASLVPTNVRGVMAMLKALKQGEQVGILPDQKADKGSGLHSPFYGNAAYTMTLVNAIAQKAEAEVIMVFAQRVKGGWHLHFQAPDAAVYSADLQTAVDALNRSVEACVNVCPAQYQWEYKRFSGQPDGSNPYADLRS